MKKKFNLRKLIITILCLVFGLALSGVFVWHTNNQINAQTRQTVEVSSDTKTFYDDNNSLKLKWSKEESNKHNVVPQTKVITGTASASHSFNIDNVPETILGGTVITITKNNNNYYINFDANGDGDVVDENEGYAILIINPGYSFDKIELGNTNAIEKTVTSSNMGSFSVNVEALDPNYTGTLVFKAYAIPETYKVDFFYKNSEGTYDVSTRKIAHFTIEDPIDQKDMLDLKVNGVSVDWLFNATKAGVTPSGGFVVIRNIRFVFDSFYGCVSKGGNDYYKLSYIDGFGNFIAGEQQDVNDPIIVADEQNTYEFTIQNDGKYWPNQNLDSNKKAQLYGVETQEGTSNLTTSVSLTNITKNSTNKFMSGENKSFRKQSEYYIDENDGYFVYNYGFYITGYIVGYTLNGSAKYLSCSGSAWSTTSNGSTITMANLKDATFGSLAEYLDKNVTTNTIPSVTITPVWEATTINVKNSSTTVGTVVYSNTYTLTSASNLVGQNFYCYKANNFIANSGTWNYIELTGYTQEDNGVYTLLVTPQYLSNIYKVTFDNTAVNAIIKNAGDYIASSTTTYSSTMYTYSNVPGLTQPTLTTTGLSDEISTNLATFYNGYVQSIINNSPIYRKIFSGTSKYIYIIHNSEVGVLPSFVHDYQMEILWEAGENNRYKTADYKDTFSAELEGKEKTEWKASYGQTLTPVYVYALDTYFEISDGTYSSKRAEWYGSKTPLETLPSLTTEEQALLPEDKSFSSWMIDGVVAAEQGYTISAGKDTSNKDVVVVSKTGVELSFRYASKSEYGNYYYGISYAIGSGVLIQNNKAPIVLAYFGRTFNLLIDNNKDIYWEDKNVNKSELYGAISSSENDEDLTTTSLKISSDSLVVYPFQTSINNEEKGVSFLKQDKMLTSKVNSIIDESNYYYVYNYGYYIAGWEISYLDTWFVYDGSSWIFSTTKTATSIDKLNGITFNVLSFVVQNKFPTKTETTIKIVPVWNETTIEVNYSSTTVGTVVYAHNYALKNPTIMVTGQEFFCYSANGNSIANSADFWNYTQIEGYTYDSDNTYTLSVDAQYLNNVYKVTLKDTRVDSTIKNGTDYSKYNGEETFNEPHYSYSDVNKIGGNKLDLSGLTMGDDISVALDAFITNYQSFIVSGNSNVYRKIFSDGNELHIYLVHNDSVGILPTFENDYKMEVLWIDRLTNPYQASEYDEDLYSGERNNKDLVGTWVYDNGVELTPVYVYRLELYYEDTDASDGIYSTKDAAWFGLNTELQKPFKSEEFIEAISSGNVFSGWMINAEMAKNVYGYNVTPNTTNKTITISSTLENFSLTFKYGTISEFNENYYYNISSVQGYGAFTQSKVIEGVPQPIVLARFGRTYNLAIDNSDTYWNDKAVYDSELYGAYSSTGASDGYTKTVMTIGNHSDYAYPFQTSEQSATIGLSFYKRSAMSANVVNSKIDDTDYYYVYNYGHYITAWNIQCFGVMFAYSDDSWTVKNDGTIINNLVEVLNGISFQDVAALLDEYFPLATGKPTVTITPIWERVNIDVNYGAIDLVPVASENTTGTISFGSRYTLDTKNISQSLEKELIAFEYNKDDSSDSDFIAISAVWNYYNGNNAATDISNKYTYTLGAVNGGGVYTINVTPVFVDNIHKVNLTNVKKFGTNEYQITNSSYEFFTRTGTYDYEGKNVLTFKDSFGSYNFVPFDNKEFNFADEYIAKLIECKTTYVNGIKDGGLEILRKVYYSSGTLTADLTTLNSTDSTFWIYLANGQLTGDLPVFNNEYNIHTFWQNTAHNDNSSCVGVDSCGVVKHYLYLAGPYNAEFHDEDIKSNKYLLHDDDNNSIPEKVWFLNDGHSGENITFDAKYFRSYYYLEVQTLVGETIERRGYVRIDVVDKLYETDNTITNRGGHYLVIAEINNTTNKTEMKVYKVDGEDKPINALNLTAFNEIIKVFNGSEVTVSVKDQSKDPTSMATGEYDEMIGYKFTGEVDQTVTYEETLNTTLFVANDYVYTASVNSVSYKTTSTFRLNVYFEKINYEIDFRIDNLKSGEFNVQYINVYSGYKTNFTLTNISVGNFYAINYFAFAGYKLKNDAFMYNNTQSEKVLQSYDDETNLSQVYTFTGSLNGENYLDGKWLRENFYISYNTYPVDVEDLGTLTIQTEVIVFNYRVLIYDETDTTEEVVNNKGIVETFEDGQFSLTYSTGVGAINPVGDYLRNGNGFWYYDSLSGVDYALLSSRMLIPQNPTTTNDNFYTTYKFLLTENPSIRSILSSSNLAFMVRNYEDGKIISVENRNIFILLEVRKIYTIQMQVAVVENDTNDSARTTYLTNGNNNSKSIIITSGRDTDNGYYCVDDNKITPLTSVTVYTYYGLNNLLTSVYNTNKYSEVRYYLNNAANSLETNEFIVERNSTIDIEYIPKTLEVEYIYMLDGVDVIEADVAGYIIQTKSNVAEAGLKPGDIVDYSLELINEDYDARVTINGSIMGAANKDASILSCSYTVSDLDLSLNQIQILVEIYPRSNARINIHYTLLDTSKRDIDDAYGTFDVYVNETLKAQNTDSVPVDVIEGRNVYVVLNLNYGYHFVGVKKGTYSVKQVQPDQNGRILLVNDFNTAVDSGDYLIVIDKDTFTATLDTSDVKTKAFEAYINGGKIVTGLYVGAEIEFTYVDVDQERLDSFYCQYPDGSSQDIPNSGSYIRFKLTSDVLSRYESNMINFGVRTISRYSLSINVVGQEYLEEQVIISYLDGTEYENGMYSDEGTQLTFSVKPVGTSEGKFKYDILFDNTQYEVINKEDIVITLNKDYSYTITITPKTYSVTVNENVYTDLTQLENGTPESVITNQVNNMNVQGQTTYYSTTTLEFTRIARQADNSLDRELSNILIADNDSEKVIVVEFDGTSYTAMVDGVEVNLADYNYSISVNNRTIKLSYITLNNITITLDYKDYKVINAG